VQASEAIPTAVVERPLSEVGVPGAKEPPHWPAQGGRGEVLARCAQWKFHQPPSLKS